MASGVRERGAGTPTAPARTVACVHCGLPVPKGLVERGAHEQFCCSGCRLAFALIHEHGLDDYYRFAERRTGPVAESGRSFEEFDHDAFVALYVKPRADGLVECDLYLSGVHCASCVWLVEKVPLAIPGVAAAELDIGRAIAHLVWDPRRVTLSAIARFLDRIGYTPHPFRGAGTEALRRAEDRVSLTRIGIAGAIAGNVMMIAIAIYAGWFGGMDPAFLRYFRWWSLLLTTPAILGPGRVFFRSAMGALRSRTLNMDVPIALALGAGYLRGAYNTVRDAGPVYFDGVATLIFLLLVGRYLQQRAQRAAVNASELLFSLAPATARVVQLGAIREVPVEAVLPGAVLDVRAGDTLAADGVVVAGSSSLDLSLLTGESRPIAVAEGAAVFAGTVNLGAPIRVTVTGTGESSRIGKLLADVAESARRRAPIVRLADRLAGSFIAGVLALAAITWAYWVNRDPARALDNAIAMLIVSCPCALALATPMAITVAIGRAARRGILVKGGDALESLARPAQMILDKTGTLTGGRMELIEWTGPDDVRPLVLALERHSRHGIALALQRAWGDTRLVADNVRETIGGGIEGLVGGRRVAAGSPWYIATRTENAPGVAGAASAALTPVLVAVDGVVVGRAAFGDPVRPDAAAAIARLRRRGWSVSILSGDDPAVVAAAAGALGIPAADARGGASPEEKRAAVERARASGAVVMVGDGVNDAVAIAAATVGIGVHGGAEACLAAADVFLSRQGLAPLLELEDGARRTMRLIRIAIAFSLLYNLAGAALAMTGRMDPLLAAILMPLSSLTVLLIAWRGRTFGADAL